MTDILSGTAIENNTGTILGPKPKKKRPDAHDSLLVQATNTMSEMSTIVKQKPSTQKEQDSLDTFGQFIVSELRSIAQSSNEIMLRQAKTKIQQVLLDTWDLIDSRSFLARPFSVQRSSSRWPTPTVQPTARDNSANSLAALDTDRGSTPTFQPPTTVNDQNSSTELDTETAVTPSTSISKMSEHYSDVVGYAINRAKININNYVDEH